MVEKVDFATLPKWPQIKALMRHLKQTILACTYPPRIMWLRFQNVGRGTRIHGSAHFLGWSHIRIGANTLIAEKCWFNVNKRVAGGVAIRVGNHCVIGRGTLLSPGQIIVIKDYALFGAGCQLIDSNHIYSNPFRPYVTSGMTEGGQLSVGVNCWFGTNVTVLGSVSIGHGSVIGSGAIVTSDIPPFSLAVGSPARILKRFDPIVDRWVAVADLSPNALAQLPDEETYHAQLNASDPMPRMPWAASSGTYGDLP